MKTLYFTNEDIQDWEVIPDIIKKHGDTVLTHTSKIDLDLIKTNNIIAATFKSKLVHTIKYPNKNKVMCITNILWYGTSICCRKLIFLYSFFHKKLYKNDAPWLTNRKNNDNRIPPIYSVSNKKAL